MWRSCVDCSVYGKKSSADLGFKISWKWQTKDEFFNQGKITVPLLTKNSSKQYN